MILNCAIAVMSVLGISLLATACSQSNNLLMGEVQATVGTHAVTVTDCYRLSVTPPQRSKEGYNFTPCRDAAVSIRNELLTVNGQPYERLRPGDRILVDHGIVSIDRALNPSTQHTN
jgi:hypothetical protein